MPQSSTPDPDTLLRNLRSALASGHDTAARLAFTDLDEWLASGGMLPSDWHLSTCMAHDCRAAEAE